MNLLFALHAYFALIPNVDISRYCVKHYDPTDTTKNVYLLLLKVYLRPPNREKPMLEPALDILTRHGSHIDPQAVSVNVCFAFVVLLFI